jgi:peptide/nickel transport system permease protein
MSILRRYPSGALGFVLVGIAGLVGLFAPWVAPLDPLALDLAARLAPPGGSHLLGTDQAGRDLLSRIIWGSRESLLISFGAVAIGCTFGISLGLLAGYKSNSVLELVVMRSFDVLFSIPLLILAIALIGIIGTGPVRLGHLVISDEVKLIGS